TRPPYRRYARLAIGKSRVILPTSPQRRRNPPMKRKKPRKARSVGAKRPAKPRRKSRAATPVKPTDAIEPLVAAGAEALGLTLDPAWHGSIAFNLRLILRHAALVDEFALPDDAEPAPVFRA